MVRTELVVSVDARVPFVVDVIGRALGYGLRFFVIVRPYNKSVREDDNIVGLQCRWYCRLLVVPG